AFGQKAGVVGGARRGYGVVFGMIGTKAPAIEDAQKSRTWDAGHRKFLKRLKPYGLKIGSCIKPVHATRSESSSILTAMQGRRQHLRPNCVSFPPMTERTLFGRHYA